MRTDQAYTGTEELVLAVSLELAAAKWKVALHGFVRMGVLPSVREARRSANQNRLRADHAI
jgi:transposase